MAFLFKQSYRINVLLVIIVPSRVTEHDGYVSGLSWHWHAASPRACRIPQFQPVSCDVRERRLNSQLEVWLTCTHRWHQRLRPFIWRLSHHSNLSQDTHFFAQSFVMSLTSCGLHITASCFLHGRSLSPHSSKSVFYCYICQYNTANLSFYDTVSTEGNYFSMLNCIKATTTLLLKSKSLREECCCLHHPGYKTRMWRGGASLTVRPHPGWLGC